MRMRRISLTLMAQMTEMRILFASFLKLSPSCAKTLPCPTRPIASACTIQCVTVQHRQSDFRTRVTYRGTKPAGAFCIPARSQVELGK